MAILRALYPDVEVAVIARFEAQAALARQLGAHKVRATTSPAWPSSRSWPPGPAGCCTRPWTGLPMAHPGGIDVVYDTIGKPETFEMGVRLLKARGTLVKSGVHASGAGSGARSTSRRSAGWAPTPSGSKRSRACASTASSTTSTWSRPGRVDLTGMLTHTFTLDEWREAFATIADQGDTGAIKVAIDLRP